MTDRVLAAVVALTTNRGSTHSAALMRILLVFVIWARFAAGFILPKATDPFRVALALGFFASTSLMLVGYRARLSTFLAGLSVMIPYYYWGVVENASAWRSHHMYALGFPVLLLALTPCGGSFSLDRWLLVRRATREGREPPPAQGDLWALRLIAIQVSVLYLFGGGGRFGSEYVSGARFEQIFMSLYSGSDYPGLPGFNATIIIATVASNVFEILIAIGLWIPRQRRWWALAGCGFHAVIYASLPVATFSVTMAVLYLAFFEPNEVAKVIHTLGGAPLSGEDA